MAIWSNWRKLPAASQSEMQIVDSVADSRSQMSSLSLYSVLSFHLYPEIKELWGIKQNFGGHLDF
jgi:hypothetical protein